MNQPEPVNFAQLKSYSDGNAEIEKKLAEIYVEQSDLLLQTLAGQRNVSGKLWGETAHALKGSSASVGAEALAELCAAAQHFHGAAEEQATLFARIESEYARVKACLKNRGLLS